MITLIGCPLRQWDIDRTVEVLNKDIIELHFCNQHHCSPKVAKVANGMAAIPNELLQLYQEIDVYGLDVNGDTVYSCKLDVNARLKPDDYPFNVDPDGPGATSEQLAQIEQNKQDIGKLSEQKVDKTYIVSVFRELKQVLQGGDIDSAIAILDEAILDLSTLA